MGVRNWKCPGNNLDSEIFSVQQKYSLPRPVAMFLVARGIPENEVEGFLDPRLANLSDPYRFPGIRAVPEKSGCLGEDGVADPELERLICLGIRCRDHAKPEHVVIDRRLSRCRDEREDHRGEEQGRREGQPEFHAYTAF